MITTDRLALRRWQAGDRDAFAAMNADPRVMAQVPTALTRPQSDALFDAGDQHIAAHGFGPWALALRSRPYLIGMGGLHIVDLPCALLGEIELTLRLRRDAWGQGFASEAGRAAIDFVRTRLPAVNRVVAITVARNTGAIALLDRLGLVPQPDLDFDRPFLAPGHPLSRQLVFAIDTVA